MTYRVIRFVLLQEDVSKFRSEWTRSRDLQSFFLSTEISPGPMFTRRTRPPMMAVHENQIEEEEEERES